MSEHPSSSSFDPSADQTARNLGPSISGSTKLVGDGIRDWLKQLLKAQHAAALQAQEDRRAARKAEEALPVQTSHLEDLFLTLAQLKTNPSGQPKKTENKDINMQ
ncbi:hypothetical protein PTTG_07420, partial [Puccinia triticina 1-1 BBBD Race 1]